MRFHSGSEPKGTISANGKRESEEGMAAGGAGSPVRASSLHPPAWDNPNPMGTERPQVSPGLGMRLLPVSRGEIILTR